MDELASKKVVVLLIGRSGQLGSRIDDYLRGLGHKVVSPKRLNFSNSAKYRNNIDVDSTFDSLEWDIVVNASSPRAVLANRDVQGARGWSSRHAEVLNLLSERSNLGRGVYLSSTHVYGTRLEGLVHESHLPQFLSGYGEMHRNLESRLLESKGWVVFRLSNVFGPPGRLGNMDVTLFTHSIVKSLVISSHATVKANPGIRRDFLDASTIAEAINWSITADIPVPTALNLASGSSVTLEEWATFISREFSTLNKDARISFNLIPKETTSYDICIDKIRKLGFAASSQKSRELRMLISYFSDQEMR